MTQNLLTCLGLGLVALAACLVLREINRPLTPLICGAFALICFAGSLRALQETVQVISKIAGDAGVDGQLGIVLRATGIGFIGNTVAELCRGADEPGLAGGVELCTGAEIMLLGLPLVTEILTLAESLL